MIGGLIGPIANLAGTFLQGRLERAKANTEVKVAEAKARATVMEKQATGEIDWDKTKPDGNPRKLLDSSQITKMGWQPKFDLETGIKNTYDWFLGNN